MAAIRTIGGLDRKDSMLDFGSTAAISASGTFPFGATSDAADGVILDAGASDFEGFNVIINVATAAAGGTCTFNLLNSADGSTWTQIASTGAVAVADLTANAAVTLPIPRGHKAGSMYKLQAVAGSGTSAGKYSAYVDCYQGV